MVVHVPTHLKTNSGMTFISLEEETVVKHVTRSLDNIWFSFTNVFWFLNASVFCSLD